MISLFSDSGVRKAKCAKLYNIFLLVKMRVGLSLDYAIIEERSRIVLFTSRGLASALFELWEFLKPLEQNDLNEILLSMGAEICDLFKDCHLRHKGNNCTNIKKCYQYTR